MSIKKDYKSFISLCEKSNINTDYRKFHYFCKRASYFNNDDQHFYEYAPLELSHRCNYSVEQMFEKFQLWNNGKKHFFCWNKRHHEFEEHIEAETVNKAKYIYSKLNSIEYIQVGIRIAYENCL